MEFHSQAGEDKQIFEELISVVSPTSLNYIEIGALDGVKYSNTKFFEDSLGWSGILVEPNPISFAKLKVNRPKNKLFQSLVSNQQEELEYSYFENENLAAVSGATSTLTEKNMKKFFNSEEEWLKKAKTNFLRTSIITPVKLDSIIEDSNIGSFGFCSIDVEGHELEVLQSFSFETEISIMIVEINPNDAEIKSLLESQDYVFHGAVAHNHVYLSKNYNELLNSEKQLKVA